MVGGGGSSQGVCLALLVGLRVGVDSRLLVLSVGFC